MKTATPGIKAATKKKQHGILHPAERYVSDLAVLLWKQGVWWSNNKISIPSFWNLHFACAFGIWIRQNLRLETNHCFNFIHDHPSSKNNEFSRKPTFNMICFVMNFLQLSCFWFSFLDGTCVSACNICLKLTSWIWTQYFFHPFCQCTRGAFVGV